MCVAFYWVKTCTERRGGFKPGGGVSLTRRASFWRQDVVGQCFWREFDLLVDRVLGFTFTFRFTFRFRFGF